MPNITPLEGGSVQAMHCQGLELNKYEFCWGARASGSQRKNITFYESFFHDGIEYSSYDCVYLHKEGEPEPYIGKILKIWEDRAEGRNKMKVLWFFRPIEIPKWLEDDSNPAHNEIFLASGQGKGVFNIMNNLDVIVGKCKVLCMSADQRNPKPSEEHLKVTDYFFYRTFDVGKYTISEDLSSVVKHFGVQAIFNKQDSLCFNSIADPSLDQITSGCNGVHTSHISNGPPALETQKAVVVPETPKEDHNDTENSDMGSKKETLAVEENGTRVNIRLEELPIDGNETPKEESVKGKNKSLKSPKLGADIDNKQDIGAVCRMEVLKDVVKKEDYEKEDIFPENLHVKKDEFSDGSSKASEEQNRPMSEAIAAKKRKSPGHVVHGVMKRPEIVRENATVEGLVIDEKETPKEESGKEEKKSLKRPKLRVGSEEDQDVVTGFRMEGLEDVVKKTENCKKELLNSENIPVKKARLNDYSSRTSEGVTNVVSEAKSAKKERIPARKLIQVTKRPEVESNKWFKELPWNERLQKGYDQGSVILIENFDPLYTSTEVEDIIWKVFAERCAAKVIPQTAISNPKMGQALVIFKTKDGAELAVKKLDEGCLMLSHERPLIARKAYPVQSGKSTKFAGHIFVEKHKLQMQKTFQAEDMKKALATSHCSQPNTIEYVMAMDWRLLQEKSNRWWSELYKQQEGEIMKVKRKQKVF